MKFTAVVDAHMQYKLHKSSKTAASAQAVQQKRGNSSKSKTTSAPRLSLSEDEKKRRQKHKGKCFRCGSTAHMMPACSRPPNINCSTCKQPGHMASVCLRGGGATAAQADSQSVSADTHALPLEYHPPDPAGAYAAYSAAMAAVNQQHSLPTPQVPL